MGEQSIVKGSHPLGSRVASTFVSGAAGAAVGAGMGGAMSFTMGLVQTGSLSDAFSAARNGVLTGALMGGLGGAARGVTNPYLCFAAGTQVVVAVIEADDEPVGTQQAEAEGGTATVTRPRVRYITKAIEDIKVGERVWSKDEFNPWAAQEEAEVVNVFVRTSDHLLHLTITDADGREQTLRTTDGHPFFVDQERRWVPAGELAVGDILQQPDGRWSAVSKIEVEEHPDGVPVYNFEVEGTHTYYVHADDADAAAVWVHNAGTGYRGKTRKDGQPYQKPGPKTDPNAPHNRKIREVIESYTSRGYRHIGGGSMTELSLPTPNGVKASRRMDASFLHAESGKVIHVNVGLSNRRGDPIAREREALMDIIHHADGVKSQFLVKFISYGTN